MRISLLISTYERPDSLAAVLRSVGRQTEPPYEVIVGDDGSGPETAAVVKAAIALGLPIRHMWEEHLGYRLSRKRNVCVAAATGDYLVVIDDDILLHAEFLADHRRAAAPGRFVQGSRALLDETNTARALREEAYWPSLLDPGIGNRKNLIHAPLLSRLLACPHRAVKGTRTCNFALWRSDFARVNGFNEDFVGWGREDSEFVVRLLNAGLMRVNLRFAGVCCHLHHPLVSRERVEHNDTILAETVKRKATRCVNGLNLHTVFNSTHG